MENLRCNLCGSDKMKVEDSYESTTIYCYRCDGEVMTVYK